MKHVTNSAFFSYRELWQYIFPEHYQDKYMHEQSGLSGGGGDYPFYDIHIKQDVLLLPEHRFLLASSVEYFNVPDNYYLTTANKSSIARQGVDASFNTRIDNGFKGYLTIEIVNYNINKKIEFKAGQPILKVEAVNCLFPCKSYNGKYQNQPDQPVGAR